MRGGGRGRAGQRRFRPAGGGAAVVLIALPSTKQNNNKTNDSFAYEYTAKGHLVGVITNGTAVLGLGNIG